jgi:hypothetical protein
MRRPLEPKITSSSDFVCSGTVSTYFGICHPACKSSPASREDAVSDAVYRYALAGGFFSWAGKLVFMAGRGGGLRGEQELGRRCPRKALP